MLEQITQYGGALLAWVLILALAFQQGFDHFKVIFLEPFMQAQRLSDERRVRFLWVVRAILVTATYYFVWGGNTQTVTQLPFMTVFPPFAADIIVILLVIGGTEVVYLLMRALDEFKAFLQKLQLPTPSPSTAQRAPASPAPRSERNPAV